MTWIVHSTALAPPTILVHCDILELSGRITDFTKQEWADAYFAPNNPYEWKDSKRIVVDGHAWVDGILRELDWGSARQIVSITALAAVEIIMFLTILKNAIPILDSNLWLGAGVLYFFVTTIRFVNYPRFLKLLENGPKISDYIVRRFGNKTEES